MPGCHATCERYSESNEIHKKNHSDMLKEKYSYHMVTVHTIESMKRFSGKKPKEL